MTRQARTQTHQQKSTATPSAGGLLQRKCACGNHTIAGGDCEECGKKKRFGLQTKLRINEPGDSYEQEADRIADQVMAKPAHPAVGGAPPRIQRLAGESTGCADIAHVMQRVEMEEEDKNIQGKSDSGTEESRGHSEIVEGASELTTGGFPLSHSLRTFYESRFGYDLSTVRIHTGSASEHLSDSVQARAFTYRNHIWLGSGERLAPSFCLAHELVHAIQQTRLPRMKPHSASESESAETPQPRTPGPLVQRKEKDVYWVPREELFKGKSGNTGKKIQDRIYTDFKHAPGLKQEVNIPNAAKKKGEDASGAESGLHVKFGIADLYLADGGKPIGVYFSERGPVGLKQPVRLGGNKAPKVVNDEIVDIEKGPRWVRVGEVKPASRREIALGKEQVREYVNGIKIALKWTNVWAAEKGREPWPLDEKDILPLMPEDFQPRAEYTFQPASPRADEELVLDTALEDKRSRRPLLDPQEDVGQRVMGGLYVNHYGGGVWAYYARPADPQAIVGLPGLTEEHAEHIELAQTLQNEVVDQITGAPVHPMGLRKPGAGRPPRITYLRESGRIQRAVKEPPRVRDTFNLPQVKAARKKLHDQLKTQEKIEPFKKLRFIGLAYEAEEGLDWLGLPGGGRLPDKNQLAITLKTGDDKPGAKTVKRPLSTLYRWFKLWTHPSIDILARFRGAFGTTFVIVADKVRAAKDKIKQKLSESFDHHAGSKATGTSYLAVAVRAIGRALKAVAKILIPQTLRLVIESLISGAKERLLNMLPLDINSLETAVGDGFKQFDFVLKKFEQLKAEVDAKIQYVKDELGGYLTGLKDVLEVASDVASTVKWTVRAIQCATPPGWGCLKLIFSSLTAWIAEKVLNYCPLQREVGCLVAGIKFVHTEIPKAIAKAIGRTFNDALYKIDPRLSPLFKELEYVPPIYCTDIGCEGKSSEWDIAYDRLELDLQKKYGFFRAARMMDALLEMGRMFGPGESEGLTAAEVDDLRRLLLLYEVTPEELDLIVEKMKQQIKEGKEVRRATVDEFGKAIEEHRASLGAEFGGESAAGGPGGTGEGGNGLAGGSGETAPGGAAGTGAGGGVTTADISTATFTGREKGKLDRSLVKVENPDFKTHTKGSHKVTLVASIDGISVKRVTSVPVYIPNRVWRDSNKTKMTIYYKLLKGVRFDHAVPSVPSPTVLEMGAVVPMTVKNPHRMKRAKEPSEKLAQNR